MGACSSKPKTTEFEGSTEPSKEADRSIDAVDVAQLSRQNESGKEGPAGDAAVHETHEVIASKGEEPFLKAGAADDEADNSATKKSETAAGDVHKDDVGVDALKPVVLDEAGIGGVGVGDTYIDKRVAADEKKAQVSITTQDEQLRNSQDINESPGVDSPIIGVILSADPIHVDDVSESVGSTTVETPAYVDSPVKIEGEVSAGTNIGGDGVALSEEATDLSSGRLGGATEEKVEFLHDNPKGSPLLGSDDGVGEERGTKASGEEVPLVSAEVQDEVNVEDTTKPETIKDSKTDIGEPTWESQEGCSPAKSTRDTFAVVMENEGNAEVVDEPEANALKVEETSDDGSSTEPLAETRLGKATVGQDESTVKELNGSDVRPLASSTEECVKDGKPEATPEEAVSELSAETEKFEEPHMEEASTKEEKMESVDAGKHELLAEQPKNAQGERDLPFEDASDVPLKVESSIIESGDTRSS